GFTLNDLVSYNHKHNEANGENNRDGANDNLSWNCGVEGPTDDPAIEALRNRQVKNFFALQLLSMGTPMLLMGAEARRTKMGTNNACCQVPKMGWFKWRLLKGPSIFLRLVRAQIVFGHRRKGCTVCGPLIHNELLLRARLEWHGVERGKPDWRENSHS